MNMNNRVYDEFNSQYIRMGLSAKRSRRLHLEEADNLKNVLGQKLTFIIVNYLLSSLFFSSIPAQLLLVK